jgi:hypothetical protein
MRKALPIAVAVLCGLLALVDYFTPNPQINAIGARLVEGVAILAAFALWLGIVNLLGVHARRIVVGERSRGFSAVLIIALLATLAVGVAAPASVEIAWVFNYVYYPLQATMAALLAFFVVSAAYRAFKLRNIQALILLVTGLVVFLTQLPFSSAISPSLPVLRDWILSVPVTAGTRGIILGVALGTITTSLRILLAVDHPYAGE